MQTSPSSGQAPEPLHETLYTSAAKLARSGLQALAGGDESLFLLHAGAALEHLAKSLLASLHGTLIASGNPKHFRSLLFLAGLEKEAGITRSQIRTVSLEEAVTRSGLIVPQLANLKDALQPLVDGRNGVAHAGVADTGLAETVTAPFLLAVDLLLIQMKRDRLYFWADLVDVVDARQAVSVEAAKVSALEKIAGARASFKTQYGALENGIREALLATLAGTYAPEKYEQTLMPCPACGTPALVEGTIEVEWQPDWDYADGESYVAGAYPEVTIFPQRLECRACGLELQGEPELTAAAVPQSWELDDVDPADFREEADDWDDY